MIKISISKTRKTPLDKLAEMGMDLKVSMTGELFIGDQPLTPAELQTLISNFTSTKSAASSGGKLATPPYLAATKALKDGIVLFGPYIDGIAKKLSKND